MMHYDTAVDRNPQTTVSDDSLQYETISDSTDIKLKRNGSLELPAKIENFKNWSSTALKCTKQVIEERLGTSTPTRDPEIETKVAIIKQVQLQYMAILTSVKQLAHQFSLVSNIQRNLSSQFKVTAQKQPKLLNEFNCNADAQLAISKNSENFCTSLNDFRDGLETFCNHTLPDTLETIRQLEQTRVIYDVYRGEMERLHIPQTTVKFAAPSIDTPESSLEIQKTGTNRVETKFRTSRDEYHRLKAAVDVKLKLLDENRLRVMRKRLSDFHRATVEYFIKNTQDLEASLKMSAVSLGDPSCLTPSFLEQVSPIQSNGDNNNSALSKSSDPCYFAMDSDSAINGVSSGDVFND